VIPRTVGRRPFSFFFRSRLCSLPAPCNHRRFLFSSSCARFGSSHPPRTPNREPIDATRLLRLRDFLSGVSWPECSHPQLPCPPSPHVFFINLCRRSKSPCVVSGFRSLFRGSWRICPSGSLLPEIDHIHGPFSLLFGSIGRGPIPHFPDPH